MRFMVATLFIATIGLELRSVWIHWCSGSHELHVASSLPLLL
jgi:hypothetical protein